MKTARPDQRECIAALHRDFRAGLNRLGVVLPTGTGKGYVLGLAVVEFMLGRRVLVLANSEELLGQIEETIRELLPKARIGWVQGVRDDHSAQIVLAMIQSMSPARCAKFRDVGLVLADEVHYAVADSWMRVLEHFGCFEPRGTRFVGFTATMVRNDNRGMGDLIQKVSFQRDMAWAVRQGHVLPSRRIDVAMPTLDLKDVDQDENGEYDQEQIGHLLAKPAAGRFVAATFKTYAKGKRGIVYAPTKKAAHALGEFFTEAGITNAVITGDTKRADRKEIYAAARRGEIQALINVGVLIAGFDDQGIWLVLVATMTKAPSRLTQMAGRSMRVDRNDPTKTEGLAVIMKGVEAEIGTIVDLKRTGARPVKTAKRDPVYKHRLSGGMLISTRDGKVIDRRPMLEENAKAAAKIIQKIDRLKTH